MQLCTIKCYDHDANRLWKSKPTELYSYQFFRIIHETRYILGAKKAWIKYQDKTTGTYKSFEINFEPKHKKEKVQSSFTGSNGKSIYTISISEYLKNPNYRKFLQDNTF